MTFNEWLFGGIDNPWEPHQWGFLHILTLVISFASIFFFYFITKHSRNKERTKRIIVSSLAFLVLFFEIASRVVYCIKKYSLNQPSMNGLSLTWILLPKPWCAISCWLIISSVIVRKKFFYNFTSISALLSSGIFFLYPGVGYNNKYILFENLYSIVTHALQLITAITLIVLKFTDFKYKNFWKVAVCLITTYAYAFFEVFVLKIVRDPMYCLPNGDIQAGILNMNYGLYITLYSIFIIIYVNSFFLIQDKSSVKTLFKKLSKKG